MANKLKWFKLKLQFLIYLIECLTKFKEFWAPLIGFESHSCNIGCTVSASYMRKCHLNDHVVIGNGSCIPNGRFSRSTYIEIYSNFITDSTFIPLIRGLDSFTWSSQPLWSIIYYFWPHKYVIWSNILSISGQYDYFMENKNSIWKYHSRR